MPAAGHDLLEWFLPKRPGLYRQVRAPVTVNGAHDLAWLLHS